MQRVKKINKQQYSMALCSLALAANEVRFIREKSLIELFKVKADKITEYTEKRVVPGKNLPPVAMRNFVALAYAAILKKLGRDDPQTVRVFSNAIQHLSEHELKLEWESIVDGTVSNIVETMMHFDEHPKHVQKDIVNIFEGLAKPYFQEYKGNVPKEDLEWAHKQIKEYFQNLKRTQPGIKGEDQLKLPEKKRALPPGR